MSTDTLDRTSRRLGNERREFQWRASLDAVMWSDWRHLCFEDEEIPKHVDADAWVYSYIQARVVCRDGDVALTSPIFTWEGWENQ